MHQQIRAVINNMMPSSPGRISVRLTSGEQTPLGRLLCILYYRMSPLVDLLPREHRFGYPHNGGQHSFEYHGPYKDFVAFLELWKEELQKYALTPEQSQVANELSYICQDILALRKKM